MMCGKPRIFREDRGRGGRNILGTALPWLKSNSVSCIKLLSFNIPPALKLSEDASQVLLTVTVYFLSKNGNSNSQLTAIPNTTPHK